MKVTKAWKVHLREVLYRKGEHMPDNVPQGGPAPTQAAPRVGPDATVVDYGAFNTITLIESYEIRYPVPSFIRDTYFGTTEFIDADSVRIDSSLGGRGLAPFILPLEGQVIGRRRPFKQTIAEAPIIAPARVITLRDARRPGPGETVYSWKSPEERVAAMIASDANDMDEEIARTEEWMCALCMFTGQIPINVRNKTTMVIDYGFSNKTALSKPWTDPTSDPLADLAAAQSGLNANGYSGSVAIYSPDAWHALWNNPAVKELMRNTVGFVPISGNTLPEPTPVGVQRAPSFLYPVMENWIYSGTYVDGTGAVQQYVPKGQVLIGSNDVKNRMIYAQTTQLEQDDGQFHSYSLRRVPKFEVNVNKNFYMQTMTARPVPVPIDLLSWTVLTGAVPAA
jgi:Phage major capsid protein E